MSQVAVCRLLGLPPLASKQAIRDELEERKKAELLRGDNTYRLRHHRRLLEELSGDAWDRILVIFEEALAAGQLPPKVVPSRREPDPRAVAYEVAIVGLSPFKIANTHPKAKGGALDHYPIQSMRVGTKTFHRDQPAKLKASELTIDERRELLNTPGLAVNEVVQGASL